MTVLLVDDDPDVRELVRRMLVRDQDVTVLEAADGLEALGQLAANEVHLVVLDMVMRGLGGLETLESIRRSPAHRTLPVIILSGHADKDVVVQVSRFGVEGFIAKPFSMASLSERLSPLIKRLRASARPPAVPRRLDLAPSSRVLASSSKVRAVSTRRLTKPRSSVC